MDSLTFWMYMMYVIAACIGVFFIYMQSKYKHRVIMKECVGGGTIVNIFKARTWVDKKEKVEYWKLAGKDTRERKLLHVPPSECIDLDKKGKKVATAYRLESGETFWGKDLTKPASVLPVFEEKDMPKELKAIYDKEQDSFKKKEMLSNWQKKELKKWMEENHIIASMQPLTTNQRKGFLDNIRKAETRKTKTLLEQLPNIVAVTAFVIIIAILVFGYAEIAAPALKANEIAASMHKSQEKQLELEKEIALLLRDVKLQQQSISTQQIQEATK